jgi:hypothetical protein
MHQYAPQVPYMLGDWGMNPFNIVFNYVVPYLILVSDARMAD